MQARVLAIVAASLVCGAQARARELAKPHPTDAAVPCPSKGPGFVRMPDSRSCIRVSGRVVAGADLRDGPAIGAPDRPAVAGSMAIDSRTDSDLGEVRTYLRIGNGRR